MYGQVAQNNTKLFRSAVAVVFGLLVFSITLDRQLNCHSYTELIFIPCNY